MTHFVWGVLLQECRSLSGWLLRCRQFYLFFWHSRWLLSLKVCKSGPHLWEVKIRLIPVYCLVLRDGLDAPYIILRLLQAHILLAWEDGLGVGTPVDTLDRHLFFRGPCWCSILFHNSIVATIYLVQLKRRIQAIYSRLSKALVKWL